MEKQEIIEIIKQNPQMSYGEIKSQAKNAGVPIDMLDAAWNEAKGKKKVKKLKIFVFFVLILIILFFTGLIPIRVQGVWAKFYYTGKKTSQDCIAIGNKYANKWTDDYRIEGITIGLEKPNLAITSDSEGYTSDCEIFYFGKGGSEGLRVLLSKYFLVKEILEADNTDKYNDLSNQKILNSTEAAQYINKYNEEGGKMLLNSMLYNKKKGQYVWGASAWPPKNSGIMYILIDATNGDLIEIKKM